MGIVDLTQNLENFKWTKYAATTENNSQIGGRHGGIKPNGQPPHPKDHSELDDGAGVPQTFYDGHSSIVTGQQTFERPNPKSLEEMVSNFGPLETEPETRGPYGVTDYMDGTKQGQGFIPPGGHPHGFTVDMGESKYTIGEGGYTLTPLSHTIAQVSSNGPHGSVPEQTLNISPVAPNAWAEDFMTTPLAEYVSQHSEPVDSVTHQVDMITLSGPTTQDYQTNINVTPKVTDAHGSDFTTLPISGYPGLYVGSGGDIVQIVPSAVGLGASDSIAASWPDKIFHELGNQQDEKRYDVYQHHFLPTIDNFNHVSLLTDLFENESTSIPSEKWKLGSIHIGSQDFAGAVGGAAPRYSDTLPDWTVTGRYMTENGEYQIPGSFLEFFGQGVTAQRTLYNIPRSYPDQATAYSIETQFGYTHEQEQNFLFTHGGGMFQDLTDVSLYDSNPNVTYPTPLTALWKRARNLTGHVWPYNQFRFGHQADGVFVEGEHPLIQRPIGQTYIPRDPKQPYAPVEYLALAMARAAEDTLRIESWLQTESGKQWASKQYLLQDYNPRPETRLYNPVSLSASLIPKVHWQRHLTVFGLFAPNKYEDYWKNDGDDDIWGFGDRGEEFKFEKSRLTRLTKNFIEFEKRTTSKFMDGLDWGITYLFGRTPRWPTQEVFSQKGAYGIGSIHTSTDSSVEQYFWQQASHSPSKKIPNTSYTFKKYSSLGGEYNNGQVFSDIINMNWGYFDPDGYDKIDKSIRTWKNDVLDPKDVYIFTSEDLTYPEGEPTFDATISFTTGKHSSTSAVGLGTSWASDSGARKGAPRGPVSYFSLPYSGLTSDTGYAPQTGFEFVSRILGENWIFFDPTNEKAFNWHKSLSNNSFHNSMEPVPGAVNPLVDIETRNLLYERKIEADGVLFQSGLDRQAAANKRNQELAAAQANADRQAKVEEAAAAEKKEADWKGAVADIHQKMSDLGGPFTIGKKSHFSLTDYVKSLGEEPTDIALQVSAFDSLSQLYGVHGNPLYTTVDGAPKALPRTSPDFLTKSYNKLNGISVNPHWSDYSNDPEGKEVWNPLSRLINYSWKFWDTENSKLKDHIGEERLGELKKTKLKDLKTNIFTLNDKTVNKQLDLNNIKEYSTLAYGSIPISPTFARPGQIQDDAQHGKYNYETTLRSAGELNLNALDKDARPAWLNELSEKDGKGIRDKSKKVVDDIGNQGKPNVDKVVDTALGVIKHGTGDKVNMIPYGEDYTDKQTEAENKTSDFIKFKFKDVVNDKFIVFRAILSGISDSITPEWSGTRYIGRPDQVYVYNGAERKLSFSFDIYPKTKQELSVLWQKTNYLVGLCYPSFSSNMMVAPFIELTIGDMFNRSPGFLDSLTVDVDDQSTWEIEDGLQLPKHVTCQCSFTYVGDVLQQTIGKHYGVPIGLAPTGQESLATGPKGEPIKTNSKGKRYYIPVDAPGTAVVVG